MGTNVDRRLVQPPMLPSVRWRGGSGRFYALRPLRIEDLALRNDELYVIARGNLVLWAGSSDDVIQDARSRARFRLALDCADRAFYVESGEGQVERMTMVWDLERAEPVRERSAA